MTVNKIIDYLEHPKVVGEFHGSTLDGMLEVDFDTDCLKKMIDDLPDKDMGKLLEKIVSVCEQWNALRVAPDNDIGTVARYQEARLIAEHLVTAPPKPRGNQDE